MNAVSLAPFAPSAEFLQTIAGCKTKFTDAVLTEYDIIASNKLDADHWRVGLEYAYFIGDPADEKMVYVPTGYLTDGASVPRLLWDLIPPWGIYGAAAVVHDVLCEYLTIFVKGQPVSITRNQADDILREAMQALGVSHILDWVMYGSVKAYVFVTHDTKPKAYAEKRALEDNWVSPVTENPNNKAFS